MAKYQDYVELVMTLTTPKQCRAIGKRRIYHGKGYTIQRCKRRAQLNGYCWQHQRLAKE